MRKPRRRQPEHLEQVALCQWWALACKSYGLPERVLFAIPNGRLRSISEAVKLKREGVRAGIPDMLLAVPTRCVDDAGNVTGYLGDPGLFIENKAGKGKPTKAEVLAALRAAAYWRGE